MAGIKICFEVGDFALYINSGKFLVFIKIGFEIGSYLCNGKNIESDHRYLPFQRLFFAAIEASTAIPAALSEENSGMAKIPLYFSSMVLRIILFDITPPA